MCQLERALEQRLSASHGNTLSAPASKLISVHHDTNAAACPRSEGQVSRGGSGHEGNRVHCIVLPEDVVSCHARFVLCACG